jgi:nitroreductase
VLCHRDGVEFREVVRHRRMIRRYDPDRRVPRETIDELLRLAIRAPSAGFSQGWQFLVLDSAEACDRFWSVTTDRTEPEDSWLAGMRTAPALIVTLSDKSSYIVRYAEPDKGWTDADDRRWPIPYWHVDAGMAALLILLGAVDAGLGAAFFGVPGPQWPAFRTAFGVPERLTPVGAISLGYPASERPGRSARRGRRGLDEVVHYGSFTP